MIIHCVHWKKGKEYTGVFRIKMDVERKIEMEEI